MGGMHTANCCGVLLSCMLRLLGYLWQWRQATGNSLLSSTCDATGANTAYSSLVLLTSDCQARDGQVSGDQEHDACCHAGRAADAAGAAWDSTKDAAEHAAHWASDSVAQGWHRAMTAAYDNWLATKDKSGQTWEDAKRGAWDAYKVGGATQPNVW